jgi:arsenite methyltransferase
MTEEMLSRSRAAAAAMRLQNVEFRAGLIEDLPVEGGWADAVISNGVINLCADKRRVFAEILRVLAAGRTFGGAGGESKARLFVVFGYAFLADKPS